MQEISTQQKNMQNVSQPPAEHGQTAIAEQPGRRGFFMALRVFYRQNKYYIWAIILGITIIAGITAVLLKKPAPSVVKEANIILTLEAPNTVSGGEEAVYKIKAENQDAQELTNLELEAAYPEGMTFLSGSVKPVNLSGTRFALPDLTTGQNASMFLKVKVEGAVNEEKKLLVRLHYHYRNFSSEFIKEALLGIRISAAQVSVEILGPSQTNTSQLVIYDIVYKNGSPDDLKNLRVQAVYPAGFNFAQSTPPADLNNDTWNVPSLESGGEGKISVQGSFKGSVPGEGKIFSAKILSMGQKGDFYPQAEASFTTNLSALPLSVFQEITNGLSDNAVKPGHELEYKITYQNTASTAANGVNIIVVINSKAVNLSSISAEGATINNNIISWNASGVRNLEVLNPGESGELSFRVEIKNPAVKDSSRNLTVLTSAKIKSREYDTFLPGNDLTVKISSPAYLKTFLNYDSGSLPPQVGKITVYKMSFELTNSSNDYQNAQFSFFLPQSAYGIDQGTITASEKDKVHIDPSTGKLTWDVGNLSAYAGIFMPKRILSFTYKLVPTATQKNTEPVLFRSIRFSASDVFTGQDILLETDDVSTRDVLGQDNYYKSRVE